MIHSIIVLTIFITFFSIALSYIDYRKIIEDIIISKDTKIKRGGIVFMINIALSFIMYIYYDANLIALTIYTQTVYWTAFDMSLNLFRKKSILYTSNNNRYDNDSVFDTAFNYLSYPYSGIAQLIFKGILLTLCLIILL